MVWLFFDAWKVIPSLPLKTTLTYSKSNLHLSNSMYYYNKSINKLIQTTIYSQFINKLGHVITRLLKKNSNNYPRLSLIYIISPISFCRKSPRFGRHDPVERVMNERTHKVKRWKCVKTIFQDCEDDDDRDRDHYDDEAGAEDDEAAVGVETFRSECFRVVHWLIAADRSTIALWKLYDKVRIDRWKLSMFSCVSGVRLSWLDRQKLDRSRR